LNINWNITKLAKKQHTRGSAKNSYKPIKEYKILLKGQKNNLSGFTIYKLKSSLVLIILETILNRRPSQLFMAPTTFGMHCSQLNNTLLVWSIPPIGS
jgi:hypothetical protein